MGSLPAKITPDAIREALFEIRFEHSDLSEVVVGTLAAQDRWAAAEKVRLPTADVPEQLRAMEPNLRHLPTIEARISQNEVVRIGQGVISHHNVGHYFGWEKLEPRLRSTVAALLTAVAGVKITRLGLRYINALTETEHHLQSIYDLNLQVAVSGKRPSDELQLVYRVSNGDLQGLVRVLSPAFIAGGAPLGTVAVVDVDIYSEMADGPDSPDGVVEWLERAHLAEKEAFFSLLNPETTRRLQEA